MIKCKCKCQCKDMYTISALLLQPCGCSVYSAVLGLSVSALPRESHPIGSCRLIVPVSWLVYRTLKVTTSLPQEQCFAILWSEQLVLYSAEFWWEVVFRELWDCEYCLLCLFCVWLYQRYTGLFDPFACLTLIFGLPSKLGFCLAL